MKENNNTRAGRTGAKKKTCNRGHEFAKSNNGPVCPMCWPGRYTDIMRAEFPSDLSAPAFRALRNEKITTLAKLATFTETAILRLHGMGPASIPKLRAALREKRLRFSRNT